MISQVQSRSIFSRLFTYFTVFTVVIMICLWLFQILFLQTFYQQMKIRELYSVADTIQDGYGKESLFATISNLTLRSDMYIQIVIGNTVLYTSTVQNPADRMNMFANSYDYDTLKRKVLKAEDHTVVTQQTMNRTRDEDVMIYASLLDESSESDSTYLFIYTPLTAVGTTIEILAKLLVLVTILAIGIGVIMSLIISRRLSRPLHRLTESAVRLGQGNFDVHFDGSGYAETEELAATLNYAEYEISKSDRLQKDIVANVSHDLKTPLTMVKSYAEMIRDLSGDVPEKRNKHLQVIISEADRLNDLVNDLTSLSKMQANVDTLDVETVDLASLAGESADSFSVHAEQDGFTFEVVTEGNTEVPADPGKIRQVFANLIGNAVRYSSTEEDSDRTVLIRVTEQPETVRCEVIDHGQGIPAGDLDQIWDRYYRSSSNHSRTSSGTGLGLAIVKQILLLHQAAYGVESIEQEGSTFWFELKKENE